MLEIEFNELDNDFITFWSRKILGYQSKNVYEDIRKLAELGQVNAVQCYYLWTKNLCRYNSVIENHLYNNTRGDFKRIDFNWQLALAFAINNTALGKQALCNMLAKFDTTQNYLILERALEISDYLNIRTGMFVDKVKMRKYLIAQYKNNPTNPQIAFALAKNLLFWGSTKKKQLGRQILQQLAKREYSKTFLEYNENYENQNEINNTTFYTIDDGEIEDMDLYK